MLTVHSNLASARGCHHRLGDLIDSFRYAGFIFLYRYLVLEFQIWNSSSFAFFHSCFLDTRLPHSCSSIINLIVRLGEQRGA